MASIKQLHDLKIQNGVTNRNESRPKFTIVEHRGNVVVVAKFALLGVLQVEEWSVWSSCKPTCGRFRTRRRTRILIPQEENSPSETIGQVETCPPRLGKDCPMTILLEENYTEIGVEEKPFSFSSLFDTSNPDLMKLQAFAAACAVLLIAFIQILRCVTFMLIPEGDSLVQADYQIPAHVTPPLTSMTCSSAYFLVLTASLIAFKTHSVQCSDVLERTVSRWSQQLYQSLIPLREVMATEYLSRMYNGSTFGVQEMTDTYARKLIDDAIVELSQMIRKKEKALEKLRDSIEDEYKRQEPLEYDECYIRAKSVSLFPYPMDENGTNVVPCNESQYLPLEADPLFGNIYVSRNISAAHVPTNVYDLSKEIRTVGNWTHHLDEVFKKNIEDDPLLKWQYFCSSTGFFKFYPGAMWEVQLADLKLDFFDCRSTAWYVGAASYPVEMIILADKSGSMKGRRNTICNATISELLNTLTDDDFFNVIYFSESIKYAEEHVKDRLIQATRPNKDRIVRGFGDHMPNGTSNFRTALVEAFTLLNISNNGTGINRCNKMIILITDGVPDDFDDVFQQYNPEKNVRVFTFLIGQHSADESIVQRIACNNRGMEANIANLADVKENVLKYIDIVARSNAILDDSFVRWSGVTKLQLNLIKLTPENFTSPPEPTSNATSADNMTGVEEVMQGDDAGSSNMLLPPLKPFKTMDSQFFVTLSRAAYDKTNASIENNQGIILGVTGLDIPMDDIQDVLRSWKTGPLSYFFGLTNNGFVLFHPNYRPMHGTQLKRYYRHVDIDEVEQPLGFALDPHTALPMYNSMLRKSLIDRLCTSVVVTTMVTAEDFLSGLPMTKKVFTSPLPDTPFTFGLAVRWVEEANRGFPIPKYDTSKFWRQGTIRAADTMMLNPQFINPAKSCERNKTLRSGAMLAPLSFCKFRRELLRVFMDDPLCILRNVVIDNNLRNENECDMDHIARIVMDAKATASVHDYWQGKVDNSTIQRFDIQRAFSVHHSGLLRYFSFSESPYEGFLEEINKGSESSFYKYTILHSTFYENMKMLVFRPPLKQVFRNFLEKNISVPMVVSGVISNPASEAVAMGIAGVQFSYQKLNSIFFTLVNSCDSSDCLRCDEPGVQCFLTTTAGQIVLSTAGEKAVSQNLKELDCALMEALVAANVVTEREVYDFQAICIEAVAPDLNYASRLFSPIAFILKCLGHALKEFLLVVANWWFIGLRAAAQGVWDSMPPTQGEFVHLNDPISPPDTSPFNFRDGDDHLGYVHRGSVDFPLPSRTSSLDGPFYRDYEVLKPFESPQTSLTEPPTDSLPDVEVSVAPSNGETTPDLPLFYETAQFYSQKNYFFEDPEDPWLMQQQAFSELNMCYASEPTLNPPPPQSSLLPSRLFNGSMNETLELIDLTQAVTTGEPLQILSGNVTLVNETVQPNITKTTAIPPRKVNAIPGTLLRCVQRIVQMRCHAAVHSNNQIGRQGCEVMCDAVRQRMPQLTEFLHDCRQPLDSCTQRHSIFYLNKEAHAGRGQQTSYGYGGRGANASPKLRSGIYCPACGNIDWVVASTPNTNLLLIMTVKPVGKPSINCICECKRRYRYGAQLKDILFTWKIRKHLA
ncbi:Voltage-dependent calcium channel subunit alpha-2/delta-3 [Echinococcus granulosus]|nr:Voltage-dependent calcium channel subunit alpha-2/delta-3 [Echinococcus granulosus]